MTLKSRREVLNHGRKSKQISLILMVFLLTSILLAMPVIMTITTVKTSSLSPQTKTSIVERGINNDEEGIIEWNKTYGGTDHEEGYCVEQTSDGGYIIVSYTFNELQWDDVWLIKTDADGNEEWNRTYGGGGFDYGWWIEQTWDRGYIITGYSLSLYGEYDVLLIKTDENSNEKWIKTFGGADWDGGNCVRQTTDGGYIITGWTYSYGAGSRDVWLIKTDENGDKKWDKTYGGTGDDRGYCVEQTTDGGYIMGVSTNSSGAGGFDVWLIKTDENGDKEWDKTYGGTGNDWVGCVEQTTDGGYIIGGTTFSFGAGRSDVWLIKTDKNGNTLWNKTYGGTDHESGLSIMQTSDRGYIITGQAASITDDYRIFVDVLLIKTDENGDEMWNRTYGGTGWDTGYCVRQTTDGGYIITGYTDSFGAVGRDVWLIKVSGSEKGIFESYLVIFMVIGVSVVLAALFSNFLKRETKGRQEEEMEGEEWEGVFFKYE